MRLRMACNHKGSKLMYHMSRIALRLTLIEVVSPSFASQSTSSCWIWTWSATTTATQQLDFDCESATLDRLRLRRLNRTTTERALWKIKRHSSSAALDVNEPGAKLVTKNQSIDQKGVGDLSGRHVERLKLISEESGVSQSNNMEGEIQSSEQDRINVKDGHSKSFIGGPSSWDPYSKGIDPDALKTSLAAHGALTSNKKLEESRHEKPSETEPDQLIEDVKPAPSADGEVGTGGQTNGKKTLIDAVKPKHKRKKKSSSNVDAS